MLFRSDIPVEKAKGDEDGTSQFGGNFIIEDEDGEVEDDLLEEDEMEEELDLDLAFDDEDMDEDLEEDFVVDDTEDEMEEELI